MLVYPAEEADLVDGDDAETSADSVPAVGAALL